MGDNMLKKKKKNHQSDPLKRHWDMAVDAKSDVRSMSNTKLTDVKVNLVLPWSLSLQSDKLSFNTKQ